MNIKQSGFTVNLPAIISLTKTPNHVASYLLNKIRTTVMTYTIIMRGFGMESCISGYAKNPIKITVAIAKERNFTARSPTSG
jgi:hypothetical protein